MKTLINLSAKKTGTSFVHNLMRLAGFRLAPEKEYYVFPRNTPGFLNLANDVKNAYDIKDQTYFSANETTAVDENDRVFIDRLVALNDFSVKYINGLSNPFQRASASLQRLSLLRHSYSATEIFVVSDPNFLTDLCALAIEMDAAELEMFRSLLRAEEIQFFSIIRHPVDCAISLASLHSGAILPEQLCADDFLENIANRCRQFAMIGLLAENLKLKTRVYSFEYLTTHPFDFILRVQQDFGIQGGNLLRDDFVPKNPNPRGFLPNDILSIQRKFLMHRLADEIELFEFLKKKNAQGVFL